MSLHLSTLPHEAQSHVHLWKARMAHVDALGRGWTNFVDELALAWGTSPGTLIRYVTDFRKKGIAAILDMRKYGKYLTGEQKRGLPHQFIEHWKGLNQKFQRNNGAKESYRILMDQLRQWKRGHAQFKIPGYDTPPPLQPGKAYPVGWSYDNLLRLVPNDVDLAFSRRGRRAAKKYLPKHYTTRVGLSVGEVIMIDDQQWDITVAWNCGSVARPVSFDLLDVFSAYEIIDGIQPNKSADGTGMGLKEEDAFWLILTHLSENGYRADIGTHIVVERGTATLRTEIAQGLHAATDGKIIVDKGGVDNGALKGMFFDGACMGNFRFKAPRESLFNLLRNWCANLEGPTGRNRDESPENWGTINKYVEKLLKHVPEERWHLLKLPLLTEGQFREIAHDLKAALNHRTDHKLEGWDKLKKTMFRLPEWGDDDWMPIEDLQAQMLKLSPEKSEILSLAITAQSDELMRTRSMKPVEVWDAGKHKLTPLPIWTWNVIIPARMAHTRTVEDCREIRIYGLGADIVRYDAICHNHAGHEIMLRPGKEVMVYVNPFNTRQALCCDVHGAAIGVIHEIVAAVKHDHAAYIKRMAQVKQITADIEAPVARRMDDIKHEREEMLGHNQRVRKGMPVTAAEHEQADKAKTASKAADAIMDADHVSVAKTLQAPAPDDDDDIMDL